MAEHPIHPHYCFLAGTGRSGTTALRKSLGQHPEIYYNGHENNIVQDIVDVARKNFEMPSRKFSLVVDHQEYCAAFRELIHRLVWNDPSQYSRPVWMAAINPNSETLGFLNQIFPGAKIICLVRNGIEVVLSRQRYPAFRDQSFARHCQTWTRSQWVFDWGREHPEEFRLFRHEWCRDAKQLGLQFQSLFQWLEIEPSDLPREHVLSEEYHPTPNEVGSDKRHRWNTWDADQRREFIATCGSLMEQLGYEIPFAIDGTA